MGMRNIVNYRKQAYAKKGLFIYNGTAALVKGRGMCFDLDYLTTTVKETATDPFGARGLKVIQIPSSSNNNAFAGVLTQNYPARTSGLQLVELALPGGCAMIAQRASSIINHGLLTCCVGENDSGVTTGINGLFGYGGFLGRGSALPLQTLAVADEGDMPMEEITGVSEAVYDGTSLTTFTSGTGTPGTFMGYVATALDASDYEATVWGGAKESDASERCPSGVYPVVQATGATTFTVLGDTGDGACTVTITKKNLLKLAYLCEGPESGLVDYYVADGSATTEAILLTGMTIVLGGYELDGDCNTDVEDAGFEGARKGFYLLATVKTNNLVLDITSGYMMSGAAKVGTVIQTITMDTAGDWVILEWHEYGPAVAVGSGYGEWQLMGLSSTNVIPN